MCGAPGSGAPLTLVSRQAPWKLPACLPSLSPLCLRSHLYDPEQGVRASRRANPASLAYGKPAKSLFIDFFIWSYVFRGASKVEFFFAKTWMTGKSALSARLFPSATPVDS